jgi:membrane protease YdiL (CAAX protease family)
VAYPEYKWTARDAWKCVGMIVVLWVVLGLAERALEGMPFFRRWARTSSGFVFQDILHSAVALLTAAYFARTWTFATFLAGFGFERKPSQYVWFGVVMALLIRVIGYALLVNHLGTGVRNYDLISFRQTPGSERYLFLVPAVLFAPVFEETVNRGFLYKGFRGSYPVWGSTLLLIGWAALTIGRPTDIG